MNRLFEAEVFVEVVEGASFTAAAARLRITKSYASKLISRLEERLGVRLLQRSTRKLSLTEAGLSYYERCSEIIRALDDAEESTATLHAGLSGRLRITIPSVFGVKYMPEPLASLKRRYPDLTIEVELTDRHVDILAEGYDAAIRVGAVAQRDLVARRLCVVPMVVCASEAYLARRGAPTAPQDLATHECLRYAYHAVPGTWTLEGPAGPVDVSVSGTIVANNATFLLDLACRDMGLVFMPIFHTAPFLRDGRLVRVLPGWGSSAQISVLFPSSAQIPRKVRVFVDSMLEAFRSPPWGDWEKR